MRLRMWMLDLAREQVPSYEHLKIFCDATRAAGMNALGLYLEHRFAYPSASWVAGRGAVTPEMVSQLERDYPDLRIIPFINLLGHFEGFLGCEEGKQYAEETFTGRGMQACPCNPDFVRLCEALIDDTIKCFKSDLIHIGGDETWQLGRCAKCAQKVASEGKSALYGKHFGPLAQRVLNAGRTPAVWGDMFADHPEALPLIPKETVIFDWQYFKGPIASSQQFRDAGHTVVFSPAIHTYNAAWQHLPQSEANVREHASAAEALGIEGVCVTTWEGGLFGNYETLLPAIKACGTILQSPDTSLAEEPTMYEEAVARYKSFTAAPSFLKAYLGTSEWHEEWARLMGIELQEAGGMFQFSGIRSSLKCRFMLYSNPFLLWLRHRTELDGEVGDRALEILERAIAVAPDAAYRGVSEFAKIAVNSSRNMARAERFYAARRPAEAIAALVPVRGDLDDLVRIAKATHLRIGGSLADIERPRIAKDHVEKVIRRIRDYGDGSLGYLPSFEALSHPKFVPHDQANWWLVNQWANE